MRIVLFVYSPELHIQSGNKVFRTYQISEHISTADATFYYQEFTAAYLLWALIRRVWRAHKA